MKVLFVATVVRTHIMEFHIPYLKMLKEMGWETAVAARNDYDNPEECVIPYCDKFFDIPFERNPIKFGNIKAYKKLKRIIDDGEYDIIHCHTPVGAMLTRLAASKARRKGTKVIYTAHGFHFYKGAPLLNWIVYYPVERLLARKTDVLITITKEDFQRAQKFKSKRVEYVPGVGVNLEKFCKKNKEKREEVRRKLNIPFDSKVLLSVGELNKNKNHRIVIEALPDFKDVYYVICGRGPLLEEYTKLAQNLGVENRVRLVGYRNDVAVFYNMADIFVFPSFREGLPVALMEAMASEMLCVSSCNRGSNELMKESEYLFDPSDKCELVVKLYKALTCDDQKEIDRNRKFVQNYKLETICNQVRKIYLREIKIKNEKD